jgi:hypothetical protein
MTLYDLTQALVRYKKFVFGALAVLLIIVFLMMFDVGGGGLQIRGTAKYESEIQIAVISPSTESLTDADTAEGLSQAAAVYADLLSSAEAAVAVGEMTGYKMDEAMSASVSRDAPLIVNAVIGPSFELATTAALNSFEWLGTKLQVPLVTIGTPTTTTLPPDIVLSTPFETRFVVDVAEELQSVSADLFVRVTVDSGEQITVPINQTAGSSITARATLSPVTVLTLTLETSDGEVSDVLRVAPVPPPLTVDAYPTLDLVLNDGAIDRVTVEDAPEWRFNEANIAVDWVDGVPPPQEEAAAPNQVKIALVTSDPQAIQIGGRRGPLLGIAVLLVGLIAIVSAVIVADTWRRERTAEQSMSGEGTVTDATGSAKDKPPATAPRRRSQRKTPPKSDAEAATAPASED